MEIIIETLPSSKVEKDVDAKMLQIVKDRNLAIAKKFGVEPYDVKVNLYYNTSQLVSKVGTHDARLGVFSGYVDYEDCIHIAHPTAIGPIFGDNITKQLVIMADYTLIKMYLCKVFYPNQESYKLYYKYLSESLAKLISGNFVKSSIEFEIKGYSEFKSYKKDVELNLALYVMLEKSGVDFLYFNMKVFFEDCDIRRSLMRIYKKEYKELVGLYQKEKFDEKKELKKVR